MDKCALAMFSRNAGVLEAFTAAAELPLASAVFHDFPPGSYPTSNYDRPQCLLKLDTFVPEKGEGKAPRFRVGRGMPMSKAGR